MESRLQDAKTKSRAQIQTEVLPRLLAFLRPLPRLGVLGRGRPHRRRVHRNGSACASDTRRRYATEGARALVRRTFTQQDTRQIVATTMAVNRASRRVLEKGGLKYIRTIFLKWPDPLPGNERGEVEYQLDYGEWARQ